MCVSVCDFVTMWESEFRCVVTMSVCVHMYCTDITCVWDKVREYHSMPVHICV